jgi:hypothetical protein
VQPVVGVTSQDRDFPVELAFGPEDAPGWRAEQRRGFKQFRWGKIVEIDANEDSQAVAESLKIRAAYGLEEALARDRELIASRELRDLKR